MSRERVMDAQDGFAGGLNTVADASKLAPNEFRAGVNVRLTEQGAAAKRRGSQRLTASPLGGGVAVQGGFGWARPVNPIDLVVAGGGLYTGYNTFATTFTLAGTGLGSGPVSMRAFIPDSATESVYIADGGALNRYNTVDGLVTNLANTPNVSRLAVYNRRLFGVSGDNELLYFSDLNDGDSLGYAPDGGGEVVVRTFGDQRLIGIEAFRNSLYLFHVSGISRFTGVSQDDIRVDIGSQGITSDVGTLAPRSIVAVENGVFFMADRGVYMCNDEGVAPISAKVDNQFANLTSAQRLGAVACHNRRRREVWLYIPDVGVYVYQYRTGAWVGPYTGGFLSPYELMDMWESVDSEGIPVLVGGDSAGWVKRLDVDSVSGDDLEYDGSGGAAYTMELAMRRQFSGEMSTEKSYRWAYLLAAMDGADACELRWANTIVSGSYTLDPGGIAWGTGTWGSGVWGGSGTLPLRVPIHGRGGFIDLTIVDASTRQPLFSRVETEAFNMGRRGN